MDAYAGFQNVEMPFDSNGNITKWGIVDPAGKRDALLHMASQIDDLIVISHGWNNDETEARALYTGILNSVAGLWTRAGLTQNQKNKTAVLAVFWPSKKFDESQLVPPNVTAASSNAASIGDATNGTAIDAAIVAQIATLKAGLDPSTHVALDSALAELPTLESDPESQDRYVKAIKTLFGVPTEPDSGFDSLAAGVSERPGADVLSAIKGALETAATQSTPVAAGGAQAIPDDAVMATDGMMASAGSGDTVGAAAGLTFDGIKGAALALLNVFTYYTMKERGGTVGRVGVAPVVEAALTANSRLRVHLIGHSFGGRLVTSLANALPGANGPHAATLTLLQAAYSHFGLSPEYKDGDPTTVGAFRSIVTGKKVRGPITITHSIHDWCVGLAYPIASAIARQAAGAIGDASDLYGGMGRNGAQKTPESKDESLSPQPGTAYPTLPIGRSIRNLNGDATISGHGDVVGAGVAWAIVDSFMKSRSDF